jgi:two-component system, chemotaxis family, CheB/CheR fusion protein
VVDTGQGIPPDLLPFVFDRFRQGQPSLPASRRGLGLGLAITRHIVELHGGTVAAASEGNGCGARFTVRLPQRAEGRDARTTMPEALAQPLPSAQAVASVGGSARRSG